MGIIKHTTCPVCTSAQLKSKTTIKDYSHTGEEFEVCYCNDCDFHFTQNAPDAETIAPYYQSENYVSHSDTQKGLFFKAYHIVRNYMLGKKRDLVIKHSGVEKGRILDIGTGTGYFPKTMTEANWEAVGIEQDDTTRNYAKEKNSINALSVSDFYNLPENEKFDAITMWHVLEHVHDLNGYLKKIHNLLTSTGVFAVAVPNHKSFDAGYYQEHWAAWDMPIHLWHFNPKTMQKLMTKNGFIVLEHKPMPFDAVYVSMLSEKYKSGSKLGGLFKGLQFARKGKANTEKCSSVIYIIKKR